MMILAVSLMAMSTVCQAAEEPLILTPYIEKGQIDEARKLAHVEPMAAGVESYAGFIQVEHCKTNLFFWFFPADRDWTNKSLLVQMHGGSQMTGNWGALKLNGPLQLNIDLTFERRQFSWTRFTSIIFLDYDPMNGFSYGESYECYDHDLDEVEKHIVPFLLQFRLLFPEISHAPLFIYGDAYASKYAAYFGYFIHQYNQENSDKINFQGIMLGNGVIDAYDVVDVGPLLHEVGLVDPAGRALIDAERDICQSYIKAGNWHEALLSWNKIIHGLSGHLYNNLTKMNNIFDYRKSVIDIHRWDHMFEFLLSDKARQALHVGQAEFRGPAIFFDDTMKDTIARLQPLVEQKYRILAWHGHYHIIYSWTAMEKSLFKLEGTVANGYRNAQQQPWFVEDELAGFVRSSGNLHHIFIREAGIVPQEEHPKWCYDMVSKFMKNEPFNNVPTPVNEWANTYSVN